MADKPSAPPPPPPPDKVAPLPETLFIPEQRGSGSGRDTTKRA